MRKLLFRKTQNQNPGHPVAQQPLSGGAIFLQVLTFLAKYGIIQTERGELYENRQKVGIYAASQSRPAIH